MKYQMLACGFVLGVGAALFTSQALSQEQPQGQAMPSPEEMQKMMQAWMATINPGEHHKKLNPSIGTWDAVTKIWMAGPDAPPTETPGVVERKWVLGERFILEEMKSEMVMPDMATGEMKKMPWSGIGLFGYDNYQNMYVGCWADNMGTQLLTMRGAASPDGKTFTYYGLMDEPMLGIFGRTVKYQTRFVDPDTQEFSIYDLHAGDDYKVVEVTYKRKK